MQAEKQQRQVTSGWHISVRNIGSNGRVSHLIWCPKRRRPSLVGERRVRLAQVIEQKSAEKGWTILA